MGKLSHLPNKVNQTLTILRYGCVEGSPLNSFQRHCLRQLQSRQWSTVGGGLRQAHVDNGYCDR